MAGEHDEIQLEMRRESSAKLDPHENALELAAKVSHMTPNLSGRLHLLHLLIISNPWRAGLIPFIGLAPPVVAHIPLLPPDLLANAALLQVSLEARGSSTFCERALEFDTLLLSQLEPCKIRALPSAEQDVSMA